MPEFLSERLPVDVRMGASYADEYAVEITTTAGGAEYRRLIHGFPARRFTINYTLLRDDLAARVLALYHRAYGKFAGFRVRCADDFSTNNHTGAPTSPGVNFAGSATNRSRQRSEQKWTCRPSFSTLSAVTGSTVIPQTGSVTAELG